MNIDLQLDKIVSEIKNTNPNKLLLQFPDGLKPKSKEIVDFLVKETNLERENIIIWSGSCYGACDVPNVKDVDLLIQFGHTKWVKI